ncbi:MAG: TRAP transporter large permease subunit [SAR324 cluster bacterium]|nr:TRAP transporter large permease subunit [SAR324 cluster bacterium]
MALPEIMVIAMFATFILFMLTGFPIAWVLSGVGILYAVVGIVLVNYFDADLFMDWGDTAGLMPERIYATVKNPTLIALPMFIFMGIMLDKSGLAEKMIVNFTRLFGGLPGGMAITVVAIGIILAATTGIVGASVTLLGTLSLPIMLKRNYDKSFATGVICSAGTLGILIPPSIMLVIMADQAYVEKPEFATSIGDLFAGAILPVLLLGGLYIAYIIISTIIDPKRAPRPDDVEKVTFKVVISALISVGPPAFLILLVLGSILFGFATITESSGIGALGAIILYLIYSYQEKNYDFQTIKNTLYQSTRTTGFIFGILVGASVFSIVLRGVGGDEVIEAAIEALPFGPNGKVIFILFIVFIFGFFLDWLEITLIILPLVANPVVNMGFNLTWFLILFAVCLQTSFLTPPVGFSLFYIKGVAPPSVQLKHIYKGVIPFIVMQLIGLSAVYYFESLSTRLPCGFYNKKANGTYIGEYCQSRYGTKLKLETTSE